MNGRAVKINKGSTLDYPIFKIKYIGRNLILLLSRNPIQWDRTKIKHLMLLCEVYSSSLSTMTKTKSLTLRN